MSGFNAPFAIPTLIPGDINVRTSRISTIYPTQTLGPYTTWKLPVKVATTVNITLTGLQTVDGIALVDGDRVLVKNQTTGSQNGIYVVKLLANWARANDLENGSNAANSALFVNEGTTNADTMFMCTNDIGTDIVGTDSLIFVSYGLGGGGGTPGGSNTDVQYNNAGVFGGSNSFTFNPTETNPTVYPDVLGKITVGLDAANQLVPTFFNISAATPTIAAPALGGSILISGGIPNGAANGGYVLVYGGPNGGAGTDSGTVNIRTLEGGSGGNSGQMLIDTGFTDTGNSGDMFLNTGDTNNGNTGLLDIKSGSSAITGNSGVFRIRTGDTGTGNSGNLSINTGESVDLGNSGICSITTGEATSGNSGNLNITTGNTLSGNGGDILLTAGDSAAGSGGNVQIFCGEGSVNSGSFLLYGGSGATGNGGSITLQSGSSETAGSINIFGGNSSVANGPDITIAAGSGTPNNGTIVLGTTGNGFIRAISGRPGSSQVPTYFINGGLQFTKDTDAALTIANLGSPPTVTAVERQGTITITDPSALTNGSSITITVNNVLVMTNDMVYVCVNEFNTGGTDIPMVLVSNITVNTSFTIQLYNIGATAFSASQMKISFVLL